MHIVSAYRARAIGFEALAKRTGDASLKQRLYDLARACAALAEAVERNPELVEIEQLERPPLLH
jgi:hypothetical protein